MSNWSLVFLIVAVALVLAFVFAEWLARRMVGHLDRDRREGGRRFFRRDPFRRGDEGDDSPA